MIVKASAHALFSKAVATVSLCVEKVRRSNRRAQTSFEHLLMVYVKLVASELVNVEGKLGDWMYEPF